jgi:hypothetical protein
MLNVLKSMSEGNVIGQGKVPTDSVTASISHSIKPRQSESKENGILRDASLAATLS